MVKTKELIDETSIHPGNGKTVLITGINGYIASVIGLKLLYYGYNLRGTSRSFKSTSALLDGPYKPYASRVEMMEVPDMTAPGAFDNAVRGVYAILHTASPINFSFKGWDNFVTPAVEGSISILRSAVDHGGPQLESFVVTSSLAAVTDHATNGPTHSYTEADWNNWAESKAKELGDEAPSTLLYPASKAAAEKAIWKFRDDHKPPFSMSSVNPTVVYGPPVTLPSNPSDLNETLRIPWGIFSGEMKSIPPGTATASYVDVRDVATVHVWCMEHPLESANQRYILSAGRAPPQAMADIMRKEYVHRVEIIPEGQPGAGYLPDFSFPENGVRVHGVKAESAAGFKYIRFDKCILDTAKMLENYL